MITAIALLGALATAEDVTIPPIVGAALFKNGFAFVVRECSLKGKETIIEFPGDAVLGTLWIGASEGVKIKSIVATDLETKGTRPAASIEEFILANVGKTLRLEIGRVAEPQDWMVEGKIISADGPTVVVEARDGTRTVLSKASVNRVVGSGGEMVSTMPSVSSRRIVKIAAEGPANGRLVFTALQQGLSWTPAYRIDISDESKLKLLARSTIVNDLGALDNIECKFITGFPNMRFLGVNEPLVSSAGLAQLIGQLREPGGFGGGAGGAMMNQAARRSEEADASFAAAFDPSTLEGSQLEDLFFYRQPGVSLKNRDRGYYVLFEIASDYKHVYTLDIGDRTNDIQESYRGSRTAPQDTPPLDVWHTLEFTNTAAQPLTTAAVTVMKDGELLGQDMLSYTSKGAKAEARVTKSLDVRAEDAEEETNRERQALIRPNGVHYDKVSVTGTIEITNRKAKTVEMRVTKELLGEVVAQSHEGKAVRIAKRLSAVNPMSRVRWTPTLKSGETLKLTYSYVVLLPT